MDYFSHFTTVVLIHIKTFFAAEVSVKSIPREITRVFASFFSEHVAACSKQIHYSSHASPFLLFVMQ